MPVRQRVGHGFCRSATTRRLPGTTATPAEWIRTPPTNYMGGKSIIPTAYNNPATSGFTAEITSGENTVEFKLYSSGPKQ